jgi:hypothetical protein
MTLRTCLVGKAASILVFANDNWTIVNTEEDIVDNKRTNVSVMWESDEDIVDIPFNSQGN